MKEYFELVKWFFLSFILLFFGFLLGLPISSLELVEGIWLWLGRLVFIVLWVGAIILILSIIKLVFYLFETEFQELEKKLKKLGVRGNKETRRGLENKK